MGPLGNSVKLIYRLEELAGVGGQHGGEEGSLKSSVRNLFDKLVPVIWIKTNVYIANDEEELN